ncbi:segregation and condensation protein A [Loigolactobacillus zhaoyuanensis]|uniref:Segregation and condensation protein A n=1 Tax=Loigolactobacillus zhaoyuanensis TaxID=2486017 RepID=A0ABW8UGG3_9LACO
MSLVALTVKLPEFEGPLDLLLHLIKVSEMNIDDIPIVAITSQYMDYLHSMQQIKLEIAGDYFVMAATLMRIKSQWLLPQPEVPLLEDVAEASEDPRDELVAQLLTYQAYKEAATDLQTREQTRKAHFSKAPSLLAGAEPLPMPEQPLDIAALTMAFNALLRRQLPAQPALMRNVQRETITVAEKVTQITQALKLSAKHQLTFTHLLSAVPSTEETVTTFMAVLELMKNKQIACFQAQTLAPITVALKEEIA